ncbi:MAG: VOC family protein [Synechococcales cyanobacterium C42_A2020_086]|nr:VOC family protein [Synechococcales cyanobacterium C42_A2020_086]
MNLNSSSSTSSVDLTPGLTPGLLRRVHHLALHVQDMQASRHFYGTILGLRELQGTEVPETLKALFEAGEAANFVTPDGTVIDLFWKPALTPPDPDPQREFTRAGHLAFDIDPHRFDDAVEVLRQHQVPIDHGPVSRPTGRGIYFYDPDGFLLEIRCDPL